MSLQSFLLQNLLWIATRSLCAPNSAPTSKKASKNAHWKSRQNHHIQKNIQKNMHRTRRCENAKTQTGHHLAEITPDFAARTHLKWNNNKRNFYRRSSLCLKAIEYRRRHFESRQQTSRFNKCKQHLAGYRPRWFASNSYSCKRRFDGNFAIVKNFDNKNKSLSIFL